MKHTFIGSFCCVISSLSLVACGGGGTGDSCTFDISDFTNGANASVTQNVWNCASSNSSYTFAFYGDGAGYSSALGAFTWDEVGCRAVDIVAANGTNQIRAIEGSIASGIGTFTQTTPGGTELTASCTLGNLSASVGRSSSKAYADSDLSLDTNCEGHDYPEALNITELESRLWLLRGSADNTVSASFINGYPFIMFGAECNLDDNLEIVCKADNCIFKYK